MTHIRHQLGMSIDPRPLAFMRDINAAPMRVAAVATYRRRGTTPPL